MQHNKILAKPHTSAAYLVLQAVFYFSTILVKQEILLPFFFQENEKYWKGKFFFFFFFFCTGNGQKFTASVAGMILQTAVPV